MSTITKPIPKEAVREYLTGRAKTKAPVPSQEEIRRQLGFPMITPTR
jgi:hypothetical protein